MESSKELELELEKELSTSNKTISDLKRRNEQLSGDLEDWKSKYSRALSEHNSTLTNLQKELLENAERMIASSLADMEGRYNKTIEKTALLEEELIEKTRLDEENQRLKDELREMTEEMAVLRDLVTRSRAVSRADTLASSTYDDQPVVRSDQSFDTSPRKPGVASTSSADDSPAATIESTTTRTHTLSRRETVIGTPSHASHSSTHGLTSSPSARAQLRASVRAATRMAGAGPSTLVPRRATVQPVQAYDGGMISKMKALETRINSAKDLSRFPLAGGSGAFGSPIATTMVERNSIHLPTSTPRGPRASMDGNQNHRFVHPGSFSRSTTFLRMSELNTPPMPSLGLPRSQTPSTLHARGSSRGAASAAMMGAGARRRSSMTATASASGGISHSSSYGVQCRTTAVAMRDSKNATIDKIGFGHSHRNGSSARGSVNGPPSSWKSTGLEWG
ncbi:related to nuclear distribution protein RO11 [Ustilago trichophora]|uniref:Related to nuclear distribution protein RO11 n=1 Tax=Ustilago trichophora TaxID=86804 RepID=A0A5C3E7H7_9BASI|nr:related to nuclear distribution protein RO11 [Ustilago trichophora]